MVNFVVYPGLDDDNEFPANVRQALADSEEIGAKVEQVAQPLINSAVTNIDVSAQVTTGITNADIPGQVASAVASDSTVSAAAAEAVQEAATSGNLAPSEVTDDDGFSVRYEDETQPFVQFKELDDSQGWKFAIVGTDKRVLLGQRVDDTWYPSTIDSSTSMLTPIIRWGDSLTANSAGSATQLADLLGGRSVYTQGVGGQTSPQIAARSGGVPSRVTVTGGIIPASGTVSVTLTTRLLSSTGAYPVVIAGVAGSFTATDTDLFLTGTFTRTKAGLPAVVPDGTPVQTGYAYRDYWPILWFGRNNFKSDGAAAQIVSDLQGTLEWNNHREHALILSIPPWVGEEDGNGAAARTSARDSLDSVNNAIRDAFPREFVDTSVRLRNSDVITATGNTPTEQDLTDISNGLTPTVFRTGSDGTVDAGHLGPVGYTALYSVIAEIYSSRGWDN